jgi:hypothetical protein
MMVLDNFQLRRRVRKLLTEQDRRDQRDRADYLRRLALGLAAERDKRQR